MTDKSYVTSVQRQCVVCGNCYNTNELAIHKQLRPVFERETVVGNGICPACKKLNDDGYIALVVINNPPSNASRIKPEEAYRTGKIIHIQRTAWGKIFNSPLPSLPMVFIDQELATKLEEIQKALVAP